MKKIYAFCFIVTIFLVGCNKMVKEETIPLSKETDYEKDIQSEEIMEETEETVTNIDWSDFVKFFDKVYENSQIVVPEEEIKNEIGEITGNPPSVIEGKEYIIKNGEAGWLPLGTKLYSIKKLDSQKYIAVYFEGQYIFYKTEESEHVNFKKPQEAKEPKKVTKNDRIYLTEQAGYKSIYKLPRKYTISMAKENGDYVISYDCLMNQEKIIDFLIDVGNKEAAMIRKVTITIEGDTIITDYIYNGESFCIVTDNTRDKFAENPQRKEKKYTYIKICEEEEGKYIVLTNENTGETKEYDILLNEQETEEYDGIHILKLQKEE